MTRENNKAILEKANALMAQGDKEGFLSFCTDDTVWEFVGDTTIQGKEALREWMATAYKEPPLFSTDHLIAEDDFVIALGTIATPDKSGKLADHSYCDVWRFQDSKIASLKAFVIKPVVE